MLDGKVSMRSIRRWALFAGAVAILASCESPIPENVHLKSVSERKATPDFALKDATGATVKLSSYKGKVVLLNFWATWCGPCKLEIPGFVELYNGYKNKGFVVLGVSTDDSPEQLRKFAREMNVTYPVLVGSDRSDITDDAYGPMWGIPVSFLIAKDGSICHRYMGLAMKDQLERELNVLLGM